MQTVQKQLEEVKNQIGLILSEQEVLSESLDEVTFITIDLSLRKFYVTE